MEKVGHLRVRSTIFKFAYHLRGKHGKSGPLEGSKMWANFNGVPFARLLETWKICEGGPLEGS